MWLPRDIDEEKRDFDAQQKSFRLKLTFHFTSSLSIEFLVFTFLVSLGAVLPPQLPTGSWIPLASTSPRSPTFNIFPKSSKHMLDCNNTREAYTMHATKVSLADELARLSLQKPLPLIPGDDKQARRRLVRQRINLLERARARSQPNDKWPTTKAVHAYQEKLAQSKPVVRSDCRLAAGVSPSKKQTHDASSLIQSKSVVRPDCRLLSKEVTNDDSAHFPFPVLGVKERAARFMPFQRLPPEIRFEIWKIAAQHPRFIEIQHFAIAKQSNIVKGIGDLVLQVVCRESREIIRQNPTDWSKVGMCVNQPSFLC